MDDVVIRRAGAEAVDRVEPLWLALHHHHQAVGGERLGPYVDDATSWTARRALYRRYLADGGFLVLAERGDALVGYAMVAIKRSDDVEFDDTWVSGERVAEIETLSVAAGERGNGIGGALLDRVDAELAALGVDDVAIAALAGNAGALRLYERRGFRRASVALIRLGRRAP